MCACVCVCVCECVFVSAGPHVLVCASMCPNDFAASCSHKKAVCFNAAGSQNTLGGVRTKSANERKCVCVLNLFFFYLHAGGDRVYPEYANKE